MRFGAFLDAYVSQFADTSRDSFGLKSPHRCVSSSRVQMFALVAQNLRHRRSNQSQLSVNLPHCSQQLRENVTHNALRKIKGCNARSVNKVHVERAARQNRENFARNSSVADANFARKRRQTHNFFDTKHTTDTIKHNADVVSLSQRRRPKFGCAQHQKRNRFAKCLQSIRKFSNGKFCTNSAPGARFCNAKRCSDSSESFSHV